MQCTVHQLSWHPWTHSSHTIPSTDLGLSLLLSVPLREKILSWAGAPGGFPFAFPFLPFEPDALKGRRSLSNPNEREANLRPVARNAPSAHRRVALGTRASTSRSHERQRERGEQQDECRRHADLREDAHWKDHHVGGGEQRHHRQRQGQDTGACDASWCLTSDEGEKEVVREEEERAMEDSHRKDEESTRDEVACDG